MNKLKRLQGNEWKSIKDRLVLIHYRMSKNGHIKGIYKDTLNNVLYTHWLNDLEINELMKKEVKNRMSAKEMFEKLGYKCLGGSDYIIIKYYKSNETDIDITFYKDKVIAFTENEYMNGEYDLTVHFLTLEELQAINKQVEELGWK